MTYARAALDQSVGCQAADIAIAKLQAGESSDPELLLRALTRTLADAGCTTYVPPAVLAGFMRRVQEHIEGTRP